MVKIFCSFFSSLFVFLLFSSVVLASHIPSPAGHVNDFAGVLTSEQKNTLENSLKDYEQRTSNEIAIATVKSLDGQDITDFTVKTFEEWKVGKKGKDNGILFLAAIEDRKMRIEVGYGLEGSLTDGEAGVIIRDAVAPEFKKENYYQGITNGVTAIQSQIGNPQESSSRNSYVTVDQAAKLLSSIGGALFTLLLIVILVWKYVLKKNIPKTLVRPKILRVVLVLFLGLYLIRGGLFPVIEGGLLVAIMVAAFLAATYTFSFLARSKSIWLGGLAGLFLGIISGFLLNSVETAVFFSVLFGALGLLLDWHLSANYVKLKKAGKSTNWWVTGGGFWGSGSSGGFGGGGSGGGGASGGW